MRAFAVRPEASRDERGLPMLSHDSADRCVVTPLVEDAGDAAHGPPASPQSATGASLTASVQPRRSRDASSETGFSTRNVSDMHIPRQCLTAYLCARSLASPSQHDITTGGLKPARWPRGGRGWLRGSCARRADRCVSRAPPCRSRTPGSRDHVRRRARAGP